MKTPIIEFKDFGFKYNAQTKPTLKNINLTINKGEKILIAGPSGCGKSTLAHAINGLIPYSYKGETEGKLLINGKDTKDLSIFDISKVVGTVLQDQDSQFIGLTVAEDIAFALENDCVTEPSLHNRVLNIAKKCNIDTHLMHAPTELSGGQKQRVSLAGVLVDDVDVLLFDEPLANLDPKTGKDAISLIDEIQKETGKAVIIIEHRLEDVLYRDVDRIILMENGRIISDTTPDKLLSTDILIEKGIREPLYITSLKYANVKINEEMHPHSIDSLILNESDKDKVKSWFKAQKKDKEEKNEDVILSLKNVGFSYISDRSKVGSYKALKDISFDVYKGEILAIVGKNGAGKSTCSKVICGFEKNQEGTITLNGVDLKDSSIKERADHIGYVMQNPNQMISKVQIRDEVALGLQKKGLSEEEINKRVEDTLKVCGLYQFRNWPISALSYGQKKRVTIASILCMNPEIIILDEPTAGQDYRHYTEIMEFISNLNSLGVTVIMITHDMHLMLEYSDRTVVFSDGNVIKIDRASRVLTDSKIVDSANLKETSLYQLAKLCEIDDGTGFVQTFIDYENERRIKNA